MLNPDYRDMLCMLNDEKVEYLVVGAHALAAHGYPHATGDIDLWVRCSVENAERVWRALCRFGAALQDLTVTDLATPDVVFQVGIVPRRIDILTSIAAVTFEDAWPRRKSILVDEISISVIGRDDLLRNNMEYRSNERPRRRRMARNSSTERVRVKFTAARPDVKVEGDIQ